MGSFAGVLLLGMVLSVPATAATKPDELELEPLVVREPERLTYVTQTTLSMDDTAKVIEALRERFPQPMRTCQSLD